MFESKSCEHFMMKIFHILLLNHWNMFLSFYNMKRNVGYGRQFDVENAHTRANEI